MDSSPTAALLHCCVSSNLSCRTSSKPVQSPYNEYYYILHALGQQLHYYGNFKIAPSILCGTTLSDHDNLYEQCPSSRRSLKQKSGFYEKKQFLDQRFHRFISLVDKEFYGTWVADFMLRQDAGRFMLGKYLSD